MSGSSPWLRLLGKDLHGPVDIRASIIFEMPPERFGLKAGFLLHRREPWFPACGPLTSFRHMRNCRQPVGQAAASGGYRPSTSKCLLTQEPLSSGILWSQTGWPWTTSCRSCRAMAKKSRGHLLFLLLFGCSSHNAFLPSSGMDLELAFCQVLSHTPKTLALSSSSSLSRSMHV